MLIINYIKSCFSLPEEPQAKALANSAVEGIKLEEFDATNVDKIELLVGKVWKPIKDPKTLLAQEYNKIRSLLVVKLASYLRKSSPQFQNTRIVLARDTNGKLQGILIYNRKRVEDPNSWKIDYLISAPWNVKKNAKRCKGVGTALIEHAKSESQKEPQIQSLQLVTSPITESFYTDKGFAKDANTGYLVLKVKKGL